jgi:LysR family transcriptional regulator, transcriptional activator AphB
VKSKPSLDDLQLFQITAQQGSLQAAAARLKMPIATLSRRLQKLEATLGCRLLERSAHHFALTDIGRHYFAACAPLLNDLQAVTEQLDEAQHGLSGPLKITAPVNMTQQWLGHCFFDFMQRYPNIRLQLVVSNQYENLIEDQLDAAIRVGEPQASAWVARHIWNTHLALCAAPKYLRRAQPITHPRDLTNHSLVVANPMDRWELTHQRTGELFSVLPQAYFQCSDIGVALNAVAANFGVVLVPDYYFIDAHKNTRRLEHVLEDWRGPTRPVYMLYRDRQVMSARLRAFVDHVVEWMDKRVQD